MPTVIEYRLRAKQYLELAQESQDLYAKESLTELAQEFSKAADNLEHSRAQTPTRRQQH
jgi:hypothetical protein